MFYNPANAFYLRFATDGKRRQHSVGNSCLFMLSGSMQSVIVTEAHRLLKVSIAKSSVNKLIEPNHQEPDILLGSLFQRLYDEQAKGVMAHQLYLDSLEKACRIHLECRYQEKKTYAPKGKLGAKQISDVIEFTRTSLHTNIGLTELASSANLSEYHFARLFRATMGMSPYKFVLEMKIEYAKNMMRKERSSFRDIAYHLSFFDQAHFNNAFKKITGFSPGGFIASQL
jgi:AraC-like DNA-binding protein